MAGGAAVSEYAKELFVLRDGARLFRLRRERNAHDLAFDKRPSS
jgi:hypothetical protein